MGESLDIVRYIDEMAGKGRLKEEVRPQVQAWLDKVGTYANKLVQPRDVLADLPEFAEQSAVDYFTAKKEQIIGNFAENMVKTPEYLARLADDFAELEGLVVSADALGGELGDGGYFGVPDFAQSDDCARVGDAAEGGGVCGGNEPFERCAAANRAGGLVRRINSFPV
ncbi:glutaredoxin 2, C-terminal domain protein [Neisseria elongata subsp. glycolytica ATCC 29315]|uniref:Glutaredoxin 2, C-terminal domain protein n=1 Tax=Neisseria elongata subsp. glycolytica ATCC 29315 TaxID=546263 RepID=D4DMI1_NEIEG|nr:glutaredoxin 2, C-terminal domain protein [Neisseria elongata subsp. glycolytica ATCC 29315]